MQTSAKQSTVQQFVIKKVDAKKQIVYGEVYAPNTLDTHGDFMTADEIEKMAHGFLIDGRQHNIDIMHNNVNVEASVVESFVARDGDPDFTEGAWVAAVKIFDKEVFAKVEDGELSGFSMEALVRRATALIEVSSPTVGVGKTQIAKDELARDHEHVYFVELDGNGHVVGGSTSEVNGHVHQITRSTKTDEAAGHTHRFFLP